MARRNLRRNLWAPQGPGSSSMRQGGRSPFSRRSSAWALPRPLTAVSDALALKPFQDFARRPHLVRHQVLTRRPAQLRRTLDAWRRVFLAPGSFRPSLKSKNTPCQIRATRKEVLFAAGTAGRSWNSRRGPRPPRRRTTLSNYSCR